MIPQDIARSAESLLSSAKGTAINIMSASPAGGGSINEAYHLKTDAGKFFLKYNLAERYPAMFEKEALGLELLRNAGEIDVPGVIGHGETGDHAYLLLEHIEPARENPGFWDDFGKALARLHKHRNETFGLDHDNYMGSLYQSNKQHETWNEFFRAERLEPQAKLARDTGELGRSAISALERLYVRLPEIFPREKPSLIHGDLWSGNYMVNARGEACLIDPAVAYGHREMDIAMSKLFGGFSSRFYEAYHREFPLESGWEKRVDICNLYPLLVHVNLFGGGYSASVMRILSRFY